VKLIREYRVPSIEILWLFLSDSFNECVCVREKDFYLTPSSFIVSCSRFGFTWSDFVGEISSANQNDWR